MLEWMIECQERVNLKDEMGILNHYLNRATLPLFSGKLRSHDLAANPA
jgi:hypothetical protein